MKRTSRIHDIRNMVTKLLAKYLRYLVPSRKKIPKKVLQKMFIFCEIPRSPISFYPGDNGWADGGCCCCCFCCCAMKSNFPFGRPQQQPQREANERATLHQMCIVDRVAAMFHCTSSCTQLFGDPVMDFDDEPPPMSLPKLTRCDETSPTSATAAEARSTSTTSTGGMGMGLEPALPTLEHLKPRDFRRKDPALHFLAGIRGDTEELENWLLAGGDPNARDGEGWALLHHASVSLDDYWNLLLYFLRFFLFFIYACVDDQRVFAFSVLVR